MRSIFQFNSVCVQFLSIPGRSASWDRQDRFAHLRHSLEPLQPSSRWVSWLAAIACRTWNQNNSGPDSVLVSCSPRHSDGACELTTQISAASITKKPASLRARAPCLHGQLHGAAAAGRRWANRVSSPVTQRAPRTKAGGQFLSAPF